MGVYVPPRPRLCALLALLAASGWNACQAAEWKFTVLLDQRPIGHHRFVQQKDGAMDHVVSEAQFSVNWLRLPVFRYRHRDEEVWRDGCLDRIEAHTHTNGTAEYVNGRRQNDGFFVSAKSSRTLSTTCVMTFAYWDKRILSQSALLNAQTGAYTPIQVESLGTTVLDIGGRRESAEHYLLKAGDLRIELWYAPDGRWLGLAAPTRDGRRMVYQLEG